MKPAKPRFVMMVCIYLLLVWEMPLKLHGDDYRYATNAGTITIVSYTGPGGVVTVPDHVDGVPVTGIGSEAFIYCSDLVEVTIPGSVTNIGDGAFYGCIGLTSVTLPFGLTSIGERAFSWCTSLGSIWVPASVSSMGDLAFNSCGSLLAISVDPLNPTYCSRDGILFSKARTALLAFPAGQGGSVSIPDGVVTIGTTAFASCSMLSEVVIPGSVASIEDGAFADCSGLTGVSLTVGLTNIGRQAFASCANLVQVAIPGSVTLLQEGAFQDCLSLATITIPGSVTSIGYGAFTSCSGLTNVVILDGVATIAKHAFYECTALADVLIPRTVTCIGIESFFFCTNLSAVCFAGNAPSIDFYAFDFDDQATLYYLPGTTGWTATCAGRPTAPWLLPNPLILNHSPGFGVQTNHFGFIISWATSTPVVVEACTNLAQPAWLPVKTNTLAGGSAYFVDPELANRPRRYYRLRAL